MLASLSLAGHTERTRKGEVNVTNGKAPRSCNPPVITLGCVQGCLWGLSGQAGVPSITKVRKILVSLRVYLVFQLATPKPNTKKTE